jgi:hypothetical protein
MVVYLHTSVAPKQQKVANNGINLRFFSNIANDCGFFCVKSRDKRAYAQRRAT